MLTADQTRNRHLGADRVVRQQPGQGRQSLGIGIEKTTATLAVIADDPPVAIGLRPGVFQQLSQTDIKVRRLTGIHGNKNGGISRSGVNKLRMRIGKMNAKDQ